MLGFRRRRRERLRRRELPAAWVEVIERNVPYYRTLNPQDRRELHGHIQVFLAEKHFEGCGGLEITDEIRVTIAAQACILLLHRDTDYYAGLRTILVYPDTYVAEVGRRVPGGISIEGREVRLGESWVAGAIVLSWEARRTCTTDTTSSFMNSPTSSTPSPVVQTAHRLCRSGPST
jgi:Mlc titration factor MtfA (ptsG expression regulator)